MVSIRLEFYCENIYLFHLVSCISFNLYFYVKFIVKISSMNDRTWHSNAIPLRNGLTVHLLVFLDEIISVWNYFK